MAEAVVTPPSGKSSQSSSQSSSHINEYENYRKRFIESTPWVGHVDAKVDIASPYNFFLTRIKDSRNTYDEDLTISFPELLDSSLGELEHSLHINYMVEFDWLLAQYVIAGYRNPPMTIVYNHMDQEIPDYLDVKAVRVRSPYFYGHQHTKMSIFFYKDKSLRVAIHTANLIESDWENRTQGVWISPPCPYLGDGVPFNYGESETLFKYDILRYLHAYNLPELQPSLRRIQEANFSDIKVFLIPSIPGGVMYDSIGYEKVKRLVQKHVPQTSSAWDLIIQCSSIGALGKSPETWLYSEFTHGLNGSDHGLRTKASCDVKIIYPSLNNVWASLDGLEGGSCLPYRSITHRKQTWLREFLVQWKSEHRHRTRAIPHIKTYAKVSPSGDKLAWFLLTSANLSKTAWGSATSTGKVTACSFEVGILFLPRIMIGKDYFTVKKGGNVDNDLEAFPVPYDLPLTKYEEDDNIFLCDKHLDDW